MQTSNWLLVFGCAALFVACGGESFSNNEGEAGDAGDAGDRSSGGSSGSGGGGSSSGSGGGGSSSGSGGGAAAGSGGTPPQCETDGDCSAPAVCAICDDGSSACATARCVSGACELYSPVCPPDCQTDADCKDPPLPCGTCPDGSSACPTTSCLMGRCVTSVPVACPIDPCEGRACGDTCTPAANGGSDPGGAMAIMTCDSAGQCVYGISECGELCMTASECAQDGICIPCAGGACAIGECIGNRCALVCPSGRLPCGDSADCPPPPPDCRPCPNGSCQGATCIDNECRMACSTDTYCELETDCPSCDVCIAAAEADEAGDVACFAPSCLQNRCYVPCN